MISKIWNSEKMEWIDINECPLRGLASDSKLTVESLNEMMHNEKEF